ncbi:MAG: branched-chain amino acid ABC transporter permease, partial [Actinomycetota bacterium]
MLAFDWDIILTQTFSQAFGTQAVVFALAAIGLNIHFGYTGLLNFGQVGFMAAGAYGVGMSVFWLDIGFWPGILLGIFYCLALALILGIPTLRLRADYLAITTIAASESIRLFVRWRGNRERTGTAADPGEQTGLVEGIGEVVDALGRP